MKDVIRRISTHVIIQSVVSILLGLFLLFWPRTTTIAMVYILAGYLAAIGIIGLTSYFRNKDKTSFVDSDLISGICEILLALVMFAFPTVIAGVFSVLLGILVVMNGVLNMVRALEIKKYGAGAWIFIFILNILITMGGVLIIINPFASAVTFVQILGILLLAKGIVDLVTYLFFVRSVKNADKISE
ncbi:MAG: HdeD family acid-resistance protein [Oscillospiraceae bacterium]